MVVFFFFSLLGMSESKKLSKKSSGVEENTDEMMPKSSSEKNVGGHTEQLKRLQEKVRFLSTCLPVTIPYLVEQHPQSFSIII